MKTPRVINAVEHIDDDLVVAAAESKKKTKHNLWLKWGSIAACFTLILVAAIGILPNMLSGDEPISPITPITPNNSSDEGVSNEGGAAEGNLEKYYDYVINNGAFATYINGKVIDANKVGSKLESVTVTGGWKNEAGEWISTEDLNAEVYEITGIDSVIAVALKFIDQGEAVTTTHYYVMMNPTADLSIVEEYVREPITQNNPGDEIAQENNTTSNGDETVTATTSTAPNTEISNAENALEKYYAYGIKEGKFSTYIGGKVIAEEKVGNEIRNVAVTAGWKNSADEWISTENLDAEVYTLDGISEDIAVALKFIDKGEAITTTHYYVIMNPNADLTVVKDYVIVPITPVNNVGDEVAQEGGTTSNGDETVTVTTKHRS